MLPRIKCETEDSAVSSVSLLTWPLISEFQKKEQRNGCQKAYILGGWGWGGGELRSSDISLPLIPKQGLDRRSLSFECLIPPSQGPAPPRSGFATCSPNPNPRVKAQALTLKAGVPSQGPNPETVLDLLKFVAESKTNRFALNSDANRDLQFSVFLPPPEEGRRAQQASRAPPHPPESGGVLAEAPLTQPPGCRRRGGLTSSAKKRTPSDSLASSRHMPGSAPAHAAVWNYISHHAKQRQGTRPQRLPRQ